MTVRLLARAACAAALLAPVAASACACGCGIFDVGNGSVTPNASDSGVSAWFAYDFVDQDRNHERGSDAPASDNSDKRIETSFYTFGAQYRISRRWTVMAALPLYRRDFTTTANDAGGNPVIERAPLTAFGDGVIGLTYTGFSPAMTSGIGIGVKLPTGRATSPSDRFGGRPYDRDTLPGTGSTDLQLTGYHIGTLAPRLNWFVQAQYRFAVATRDTYRPGNDLNAALGISLDLSRDSRGLGIKPGLQLLGSLRARDSGAEADPLNSGYRRLLIAPGVRIRLSRQMSLYGDVELPLAQFTNSAVSPAIEGTAGQLVAPALFKLQVNVGF